MQRDPQFCKSACTDAPDLLFAIIKQVPLWHDFKDRAQDKEMTTFNASTWRHADHEGLVAGLNIFYLSCCSNCACDGMRWMASTSPSRDLGTAQTPQVTTRLTHLDALWQRCVFYSLGLQWDGMEPWARLTHCTIAVLSANWSTMQFCAKTYPKTPMGNTFRNHVSNQVLPWKLKPQIPNFTDAPYCSHKRLSS